MSVALAVPNNTRQGCATVNSSTLHLLHRVHQCASELFQEHMADIDVTTTQYTVLVAAAERDGLSQQDIISATGIDRSTVSQVVQLLTRKGLLKRRRTRHDARAYAITLTDAGRKVLNTSAPIIERVEEALIEALPAARAKTFLANLRTIVAALEPAKP
jgi:DNA-binding MarR family transcriptional regulator